MDWTSKDETRSLRSFLLQVYKDYNSLVESMKHQIEKLHDKRRNQHDAKDDADAVVAETTQRLRRAYDDLETERQRVEALNEKLRKCESDLETIPLLRAQVTLKGFCWSEIYEVDCWTYHCTVNPLNNSYLNNEQNQIIAQVHFYGDLARKKCSLQ